MKQIFFVLVLALTTAGIPCAEAETDFAGEARQIETALKDAKSKEESDGLAACLLDVRRLPTRIQSQGIAANCLQQGAVYVDAGQYKEAQSLLEMTLRLRESIAPKDELPISEVHDLIGQMFNWNSKFDLAQQQYEKALAIREKWSSKRPDLMAETLSNRSNNYFLRGDYDQAESDFRDAMQFLEKAIAANVGDASVWDEARLLCNLAARYRRLGMLDKSLQRYEEALNKFEEARIKATKAATKEAIDQDLAKLYNGLAMAQQDIAKYKPDELRRADENLAKSLKLLESARLRNLDLLSTAYCNRGMLRMRIGDLDAAEVDSIQALQLGQQQFGLAPTQGTVPASCEGLQAGGHLIRSEHQGMAIFMSNYGELLRRMGRLEDARRWQQCALDLRIQLRLGDEHMDTAESRNRMADLELARGDLQAALPYLEAAALGQDRLLNRLRLFTTDSEMMHLLDSLERDAARIYSLVVKYPNPDPKLRDRLLKLALRTALLRKARDLDQAANPFQSLMASVKVEDRALVDQLRDLNRQLAEKTFAPPLARSDHDAIQLEVERRRLAQELETMQQDLVRRGAHLEEAPDPEKVVDQVKAALSNEKALLEVVSFQEHGPGGTKRYLAFLLGPNGKMHASNLGPADKIHSALAPFLAAISFRPSAECSAAAPVMKPGAANDPSLWDLVALPLEKLLGEHRDVYVSADDQLNLLPLAALGSRAAAQDSRDDWLRHYRFIYLNSGRDLLRRAVPPKRPLRVIALANPAAGRPASDLIPAPLLASREVTETCEAQYLPGTEAEGRHLKELIPSTELFIGRAASKDALLNVRSPALLHVGTDFFAVGAEQIGCWERSHGSSQDAVSNPLLRCGLLATAEEGQKNGIVSCLEISALDLLGTEIVNMAGCKSGRGHIIPGHGVYGLRRAVFIAGAQTLVSGLWDVSDSATKELMMGFYQKLLSGEDRVEALHSSAVELRNRCPHPYYWAPFILSGKGGVLPGWQELRPSRGPSARLPITVVIGLIMAGLAGLALWSFRYRATRARFSAGGR